MQGWFLDYLILMTSIRVAVIVNAFTVVATNFSHFRQEKHGSPLEFNACMAFLSGGVTARSGHAHFIGHGGRDWACTFRCKLAVAKATAV